MEVCQEYYGLPPPPVGFGQPLQLFKGDIIELTRADVDLAWWEVRPPEALLVEFLVCLLPFIRKICLSVCVFICLLVKFFKNQWLDFNGILKNLTC